MTLSSTLACVCKERRVIPSLSLPSSFILFPLTASHLSIPLSCNGNEFRHAHIFPSSSFLLSRERKQERTKFFLCPSSFHSLPCFVPHFLVSVLITPLTSPREWREERKRRDERGELREKRGERREEIEERREEIEERREERGERREKRGDRREERGERSEE